MSAFKLVRRDVCGFCGVSAAKAALFDELLAAVAGTCHYLVCHSLDETPLYSQLVDVRDRAKAITKGE